MSISFFLNLFFFFFSFDFSCLAGLGWARLGLRSPQSGACRVWLYLL